MKYPPPAAASLLLLVAPLLVVARRVRRRDARDAPQDASAALRQRIAALQAQVDHLERQVRDVESEQDEFLATLSHELRSPLNAMLGWIELLRLHVHDHAHRDRAIDVIERNARAELRVVGELLDMARLVTHRVQIAREPVRLGDLAADAVAELRAAAAAKEMALQLDVLDAAETTGDPFHLRTVVTHLLDNAIKFTPSGGRVAVTVRAEGTDAMVTVADTGIGVSPDMLPFVFDRFRQVDRGLTRQFGGLGLGLTIVKHLVAMHGGTVEVESDGPDAGTRVTVRLPRRPPFDRPGPLLSTPVFAGG